MELGPVVVFLTSLLPFPLCYVLSTQPWIRAPGVILAVGVLVLIAVAVLPYLAVRRMKKPDFILKVLGLFMFACMIDLIIALEADGLIPDLMGFYLKDGEPYLWTSYGTMLNYWDGIVHYALSLWMLYCAAVGRSYRKMGLFWVGSMVNSVVTLVSGSAIGTFGIRLPYLLNLPYLLVPIWIAYKLLASPSDTGLTKQNADKSKRGSLLRRPVDVLFSLYFLFALIMDIFRGFVALGSKVEILEEYLHDHEPYILHPYGYSKVQMIVNMMYFVPFYACALYGLLIEQPKWLPDWALLFAGAAAQGQFVHLTGSVHPRTDGQYTVPQRSHSQQIFWLVNIALFVGPLLFALKCNISERIQSLNANTTTNLPGKNVTSFESSIQGSKTVKSRKTKKQRKGD